jgi:predicted O-methyltransferase YrrM
MSLKRAVAGRLVRTKLGERTLWYLARNDPQPLIEALGPRFNREPRFSSVERWPDAVDGFDDLAFLFASTQLNHGIISLAFDESAYLFRIARELGPATIAEIGRYKGGSTLLLAAAMHEDSTLWSYDLHVKLSSTHADLHAEVEVEDALARYGLGDRVHLVVADSKSVEPPAGGCDLVFVDGDHTYEGVRGDYENWRGAVRPGGHILFHDAEAFREFAIRDPEVVRLIDEIRRDDADQFREVRGVGALVHFVRTDAPASWATR